MIFQDGDRYYFPGNRRVFGRPDLKFTNLLYLIVRHPKGDIPPDYSFSGAIKPQMQLQLYADSVLCEVGDVVTVESKRGRYTAYVTTTVTNGMKTTVSSVGEENRSSGLPWMI